MYVAIIDLANLYGSSIGVGCADRLSFAGGIPFHRKSPSSEESDWWRNAAGEMHSIFYYLSYAFLF